MSMLLAFTRPPRLREGAHLLTIYLHLWIIGVFSISRLRVHVHKSSEARSSHSYHMSGRIKKVFRLSSRF